MLLILIPAVWLSIAMFVVLLCRAAANADSVLLASTERAGSHVALGVSGSQPRATRTWRRVDARERAGAASRAAASRPRPTRVGS